MVNDLMMRFRQFKFAAAALPLLGFCVVVLTMCGESSDEGLEVGEAVVTPQANEPAPPAPLSYNRDVRPILSDKCFACHGPDRATVEADLRLDVAEGGEDYDGAHAYAAIPGKPDESELVDLIHSSNPKHVMPPAKVKNPLNDDEKAILVRWIEEGAVYEEHWGFADIRKLEPPLAAGDAWSRNAIDRFVYAKLQERGIEPAADAGRLVWLRRVTQDLTGLPPTLEAIEAFVADESDNAYETVARKMWPWRDWVIKAYRQNMPFDQFVTEQLAGDLLPDATEDQRLATGFNRNHPFTIEGGVINEEYRVTYINDRTTTMGTLFMGLTLECSRCHDHKYDPVSITRGR